MYDNNRYRDVVLPNDPRRSLLKVYTPWELNGMSLEERKVALESAFGRSFHVTAAEHVTWIFSARDTNEPTDILGHASAFMLDRGGGPILITAAHVYRQYLDDQRRLLAADRASALPSRKHDGERP